jgi:MFS family permease
MSGLRSSSVITKSIARTRAIYAEFPAKFWVLVAASFVDRVGGTLIFPFFTLYITDRFDVGMTQAGMLLGTFHLTGLVGNVIGGALADRFGRKAIVLFGLTFSALSALSMGFVNRLEVFFVLAMAVGLLSDIAGPAWQAMVADILPEDKRTEGFGVLRVVGNLAWIVGPSIGGFMAARSYLSLFVMDAVASLITAAIVLRLIPETKPAAAPGVEEASLAQTVGGYGKVLADRAFMAYVFASMAMTVVYIQMYNSLSVYLRDNHGVSPQGYGFVLTTSAITVILFQFWVSRRVKNYPPMLMMALGAAFYMVGFSMYGFVAAYALFLAAMVVITIGEMIVMPTSQALAVSFSPEDMRGRYMAVFGLSWALPAIVGPTAAGIVMDNFDPNWVWYIGGMLCFVSVVSFLALHKATQRRLAKLTPQPGGHAEPQDA